MSAEQTAGYDLMLQFSEQPVLDVIGALTDGGNLLCQLVDAVPLLDIDCGEFTASLTLDRPGDVSLPASATNLVDIQLGQPPGALVEWSLRMVVGMHVNRTAPGMDVAELDFRERLHHLHVTLGGSELSGDLVRAGLRDVIGAFPLFSLVVDRDGSTPGLPTRLDARVLDGAGASGNAVVYGLTFPGGTPGNLDALTESLVERGNRGTLVVGFPWLWRLMAPLVAEALDLDESDFENGQLQRTVRIDDDENVDLTRLDFEPRDGFIRVTARVEKSGTCYTASGTVGGEFRLDVHDGNLRVDANLTDPDLHLHVPWYCWLGVAFLGGLLGGILGGILAPLILHLVTSTVEGVVDRVADGIVDALNGLSPEGSVPAVGIRLLFDNAYIDDIAIGCRAQVEELAPVRASGSVRLRPGQALDLDTGRVADGRFDGADLEWVREGHEPLLQTLCSSRLAETASHDFGGLLRYRLYGLDYAQGVTLPASDLGEEIGFDFPPPFDAFDQQLFIPNLRVYAVRTNERRYAVIQVVDLDEDRVRLRYRTYGQRDPVVQIRGGFRCDRPFTPPPVIGAQRPGRRVPDYTLPVVSEVLDRLAPREVAALGPLLQARSMPTATQNADDDCGESQKKRDEDARSKRPARVLRALRPLTHALEPHPPPAALEPRPRTAEDLLLALREAGRETGEDLAVCIRTHAGDVRLRPSETLALLDDRRATLTEAIGRWEVDDLLATRPQGRFDAVVEGLSAARSVRWWVNDVLLAPDDVATEVDGIQYTHTQTGRTLMLRLDAGQETRFELRVAVEDDNGKRLTTSTCVTYTPTCPRPRRAVPHWKALRAIPLRSGPPYSG